jgi:hypothetical protein
VLLSDDAILAELLLSYHLHPPFFFYIIHSFFLLKNLFLADVGDNIFLTLQDFLLEDDLLILPHIHLTPINLPTSLLPVYPS